MKIDKSNINEIFGINFIAGEEHEVDVNCIVDAGLNPREVDIKYAEQIPLSVPPIILGIIKNDDELNNKLIIIDGNHRMYSYLNVHCVSTIKAIIKVYQKRTEAIIDAYKYNINHGKRLSDKEIANGIKKITALLKESEEDSRKTFTKLSEMLNVPLTSVFEYVSWEKVENVLGEKIERMKAVALYFFLKDKDKGTEKLKKFWELNKNLSYRKFREATRMYKQTGKILDYEQYKVQEALSLEDEEDGIETETVIKPHSLNSIIKNSNDVKETTEKKYDYKEPEKEEIVKDTNKIVGYEFSRNDDEPEDTGEIEVIQPTRNTYAESAEPVKQEDKLVTVKGLVRKFSFDTVMENIFNELQEDVLNTNNLLNETLENGLHNNRDMFEKHKDEYLSIIKNCRLILDKMEKTLNKANRDYKG